MVLWNKNNSIKDNFLVYVDRIKAAENWELIIEVVHQQPFSIRNYRLENYFIYINKIVFIRNIYLYIRKGS